MFGMHRFNTIINLFVNTFLCLELCAFVLFRQHALFVGPFLIAFVTSFAVGYTVGDLIPLKAIGDKFAAAIGLKQGGVFFVISTLVIAIMMTFFMSIIMTFINVGFAPFYFQAWWSLFPYLLVMAFATELICVPIAIKLAIKLTAAPAPQNVM